MWKKYRILFIFKDMKIKGNDISLSDWRKQSKYTVFAF